MEDTHELIWNLKRLIRDGFPSGLPINKFESEYKKYFSNIQPTPSSIEPTAKNWADVFRKSDRFVKRFRLDKNRKINVLLVPERDLPVYFTAVCYTQYVMARHGAKADPDKVWSDLSESDEEDEDDWMLGLTDEQGLEPARRNNGPKSEANTATLDLTTKKMGPEQKQTKETPIAPSKSMNRKVRRLTPQPVTVPASRKKSGKNSSPKKASIQQKKRKTDLTSDSDDLSSDSSSSDSDSSSSEGESATSASTTSSSESSDSDSSGPSSTQMEMESSESISKLLLQDISTPLPIVDKLQNATDIMRILEDMYQPSVCKLCDTQLNVVHRKLHYQGKLHKAQLLSLLKRERLTHLTPGYFTWKRVTRRNETGVLPWEQECFNSINFFIDLFSTPAIHSPAVAEAVRKLRILQMLVSEGYLSSQPEFQTELQSQVDSVFELEVPEDSPEFDTIWGLQETVRTLNSSTD